jgi:hypothetical protein
MPFDGKSFVPDLTVPSLENLAFMLRHRETWPADFEWNYVYLETCAIGLADRMWPMDWRHRFDLTTGVTCSVWLMLCPEWFSRWYVASRIAAQAKRQSIRV